MARKKRKRNYRYCVFVRELLFFALGRFCCDCGSTSELSFDIVEPLLPLWPRDGHHHYHHRRMSWRQRMSFYWHQFCVGNLAVRCLRCNAIRGGHRFDIHFR